MDPSDLFIFARFHAKPGQAAALEAAMRAMLAPTRAEPGCIEINAFRGVLDGDRFYIHSRWRDEAAFDRHAGLPHTAAFIAAAEPLIMHALDVARTERL